MAGVEINITVEARDIASLLLKVQKRLGDLTPAMQIIGEIVQASTLRNFEVGGRPAWRSLSDITVRQREAQKKWPGQILVRSGDLMRSISYKAEPDKVVLSANKVYAAVHQFGAKKGAFGQKAVRVKEFMRQSATGKKTKVRAHERKTSLPWGNIPARPFMVVQPEDWEEIRESLKDFLAQP